MASVIIALAVYTHVAIKEYKAKHPKTAEDGVKGRETLRQKAARKLHGKRSRVGDAAGEKAVTKPLDDDQGSQTSRAPIIRMSGDGHSDSEEGVRRSSFLGDIGEKEEKSVEATAG